MDEFVTHYGALSNGVVAAIQKIGIFTIPIVVCIAIVVNYFGGEKAIRAVGAAIAVVAILSLVLANVAALSSWIQSL